ncbi:hypothetical protein Glove_739g3 [Diversispora epigaea]|uniref:Uncharacterized protein n=1 Tax=Diversispora epigaea TaxID=1348612 RepID=A0A397G609_9GLOM|nr:hypothetical protein Glove_739g3 [Diversispora epigaea]
MGKGAIGNLASTATVAASSIEMKIKDPKELIDLIDPEKYKKFLEQWLDQGSDLPLPPLSFTGSITGKNVEGKKSDGVFIGACTTAEEDLILAALVLEQGLKKGYRPSIEHPDVLMKAKFGLVVKTETLETGWYGKGAIGNLASTATVAASSIEMKIKDPKELIDLIDPEKYKKFLEQWLDQGSDLPLPPLSFTGSITGKVKVFEDNVGRRVYSIRVYARFTEYGSSRVIRISISDDCMKL